MIGEVSPLTTPTQYVVLRITSDDWGAGTQIRAEATDSRNNQVSADSAAVEEGGAPVLRVGPFMRSSTAAVTVELLDAGDQVLDTWSSEIEIVNPHSPAVIVRQAVYDILEDAGIDAVFLLTDGLRRPASAAEDIPFTAASIVVEVGAPSSRKQKKTPVRSEVTCEIPINVYVFGYSTGEAFTHADNTAWAVQSAVDATPNLYLSGLGVNNFTWVWDARPPEVIDVQGSPVPVVLQEMVLTVPVIWVTAPSA